MVQLAGSGLRSEALYLITECCWVVISPGATQDTVKYWRLLLLKQGGGLYEHTWKVFLMIENPEGSENIGISNVLINLIVVDEVLGLRWPLI